MATRCTKCGSFLNDNERFCPNCGENAPQPAPSAPQYNQQYNNRPYNQYGQQYSQYGQPPAAPVPSYNLGYAQPYAEEMTVGKWVGLILLTTCLGLISLILLFVWAFGSGPKARQNYCRAMLIVYAIGIVLSIFLLPIIAAVLSPLLYEISGSLSGSSYYFANEFMAFFSNFIH